MQRSNYQPDPGRQARRMPPRARRFALLLAGFTVLCGCTPVRPEQRAILADRIMQFASDARAQAALEHALENREGSIGGGSVQGGGCGCN